MENDKTEINENEVITEQVEEVEVDENTFGECEKKENDNDDKVDKSFMDRLLNKNDTEKVKKMEKEVSDLKNSLQRSQAEFQNYKKRVESEKTLISIFANEKIICDLLTTLDNLDRALDSIEDVKSSIYEGVSLTRDELKNTLTKFGLSEIDNSIDFDPNFHHAIMQEEGEKSGEIIDVFQKGYMLKDKVIRASMVKVSK